MGKALLIILSIFSPLMSIAEENTLELITFDFRGHKMGDPLSEQELVAQGYDCGPSSDFDRFCKAPFSLEKGERIGGVLVHLHYYLLDGKFARLYIGFGWAANDTMREAFTAKFGPPQETGTEILQNRMGASFDRKTYTWRTTTGPLVLSEGINSQNGGNVSITWTEAERRIAERKKAKGAEAAKDL